MLEAVRKGFFSNSYLVTQQGTPIVEIEQGWWRERGMFTVDHVSYTISRHGMGGNFVLEDGQGEVISANKSSMWTRAFDMTYQGRPYRLEAKSMWGREFLLLSGNEVIGSIRPQSTWTTRATIELPNFPLPVCVFLTWLVLMMWQRSQQAAATSAAASS